MVFYCLSFSIVWGLAAVFMLNIIHPTISSFISILDNTIGNIMLFILLSYWKSIGKVNRYIIK